MPRMLQKIPFNLIRNYNVKITYILSNTFVDGAWLDQLFSNNYETNAMFCSYESEELKALWRGQVLISVLYVLELLFLLYNTLTWKK